MTLAQAKNGQRVNIVAINNADIRAQVIRFGIMVGTEVQCAGTIPKGPIIIAKGKQEIAVGRKLAENILIQPA